MPRPCCRTQKRAWFGSGEIHLPSTPTRQPASMSAACRSMSSMRRSCPRLVSGPDGDARLDHLPRLARRGRALKGQGAPTVTPRGWSPSRPRWRPLAVSRRLPPAPSSTPPGSPAAGSPPSPSTRRSRATGTGRATEQRPRRLARRPNRQPLAARLRAAGHAPIDPARRAPNPADRPRPQHRPLSLGASPHRHPTVTGSL